MSPSLEEWARDTVSLRLSCIFFCFCAWVLSVDMICAGVWHFDQMLLEEGA
jgi:hypothetical protein